MSDWHVGDLCAAARAVGVISDDIVFSHANLAGFGFPLSREIGQSAWLGLYWATAFDGTMCAPAFTYSPCRQEVFDPTRFVPGMGALSEHLWSFAWTSRSLDPVFSIIAFGPHSEELTRDVGEECFGPDSFWARLLEHDGIIVNLNLDAWSTFLHYCEKQVGVPYREDRTFHGEMLLDGETVPVKAVYYSRDPDDPRTEPDYEAWDTLARESGVAKSARCGRGEVLGMRARDVYELATETLRKDPWFLVQGDG